MTKDMKINFLVNSCSFYSGSKRMTQSGRSHRCSFDSAVEEVFLGTTRKIILPQLDEDFSGQNGVTVFASFAAVDADLAFTILSDQIIGGESENLSPAQSRGVQQTKHYPMFGVEASIKQTGELFPTEYLRQRWFLQALLWCESHVNLAEISFPEILLGVLGITTHDVRQDRLSS